MNDDVRSPHNGFTGGLRSLSSYSYPVMVVAGQIRTAHHAARTLAVCMFVASQSLQCPLVNALDPAAGEGHTGAAAS